MFGKRDFQHVWPFPQSLRVLFQQTSTSTSIGTWKSDRQWTLIRPPLLIHIQVLRLVKQTILMFFTLGTPWKDKTQRQHFHFHLLAQVSEPSRYPPFSLFSRLCRGPRSSEIHPAELHMELWCFAYQARRGNLLHHGKHGVVLAFTVERGSMVIDLNHPVQLHLWAIESLHYLFKYWCCTVLGRDCESRCANIARYQLCLRFVFTGWTQANQ